MSIPYIIVAGGKGKRLGANIPKQYVEINHKPIIFYTIKELVDLGVNRFIIAMDLNYMDYLDYLLKDLGIEVTYVQGGNTRFESVQNGLSLLNKEDIIVAIHDSVRPFMSKRVFKSLEKEITNNKISGVIPGIKVKDTIKIVKDSSVVETLNRDKLVGVGTPQYVRVLDYRLALKKADSKVTDDASILEKAGFKVKVIEGDSKGFKITDSLDLKLFETLIKEKK